MIRKYPELFRVVLQHDFYAGHSGRDLILRPSSATQRLMQQYGLVWGARPEGYLMACCQEGTAAPKLSGLKETAVLRFFLECKHPWFLNITAVPFFNPAAYTLYFDNLNASLQGTQPFSLAQAASAGAADLLPVRGAEFTVEPASGKILALHDAQNQAIFSGSDIPAENSKEWVWRSLNDRDRPNAFRINLAAFPPGKYSLDTGSDEREWFFYAGAEHRPGDLAVVDIYLGRESAGMVPPPHQPLPMTATGPFFLLSFGARSTYWRYFAISSDDKAILNLEEAPALPKEINSPAAPQPTPFFQIEPPRLLRSGAKTAIPVSASTWRPLQEKPDPASRPPKLKFTKKKENGDFNSDIELPNPDWRSISHETPVAEDHIPPLPADWRSISPEGEVTVLNIYSDMYIYL